MMNMFRGCASSLKYIRVPQGVVILIAVITIYGMAGTRRSNVSLIADIWETRIIEIKMRIRLIV
jgi:dolichyl-phosphate-mannose--protein O-mannosyl transferase